MPIFEMNLVRSSPCYLLRFSFENVPLTVAPAWSQPRIRHSVADTRSFLFFGSLNTTVMRLVLTSNTKQNAPGIPHPIRYTFAARAHPIICWPLVSFSCYSLCHDLRFRM